MNKIANLECLSNYFLIRYSRQFLVIISSTSSDFMQMTRACNSISVTFDMQIMGWSFIF